MIDLTSRRREAEWMDEPGADPDQLRRSLRFIRQVNRLFGYTRATLSHFDRFSSGWPVGQTIRILDVATGSADVPRAMLRWARRRGLDVQIVGMDLQPVIASEALAGDASGRLRIIRANALRLPFADGSFDYAMTSMFLHHLDDDQIVRVLAEMGRVARRGVVVADLLRNRRAYGWISLFTLLANPMVRHDARVSVAQALTKDEIVSLRDRAGLGFAAYRRHFGHRFVLAGEKPPTAPPGS